MIIIILAHKDNQILFTFYWNFLSDILGWYFLRDEKTVTNPIKENIF